jgi:hypothetical protein
MVVGSLATKVVLLKKIRLKIRFVETMTNMFWANSAEILSK